MRKLLVVEDSSIVMKVLKHVLSTSDLFDCYFATSYAQAKTLFKENDGAFFAALVDLNLPDAPDGEVVDYTLSNNIPTIVLTGSFSEERRSMLLAKGIVDYVTKEGRFSYEYALSVLVRLVKNQDLKVLVVDDSETARKFISSLLRLHLFQVLEASDGVQAIKVILENPDLKLLITDFNMPRMDGCELVKNIRLKYEKTDLVIIGLSSETEGSLSARFIKSGANDFLRKPFNHEEFYCRVSHNVEFLEICQTLRDAANRDELTGAYKRGYFFELAKEIMLESRAGDIVVSAAIVDLDDFQRINDDYGLDVGDKVMQAVAQEFNMLLDRFIYARAGGKKFYLLMPGLSNEKAVAFVDKVRQILGSDPIDINGYEVSVTFTSGVSSVMCDSVEELIASASTCLLRATEAGGDLVFGD